MKPAVVLLCCLILFILIKPSNVSAQVSISGRVLSRGSSLPISNVNVFLSNATIGDKTSSDGTFTLKEVIPGKYELVVSIIGFKTYSRAITISTQDLKLPDIILSPKVTELHEVKIKPLTDWQRELYYSWFRAAFLGPSDFAKDCTILNPRILDFSYDKITSKLSASTADFLEIKNEALGYKVKYLLSDFVMKDPTLLDTTMISYHGFVLFEELKGTFSKERLWKKSRQEAYGNSLLHFLRSLLDNESENEGFYAQQLSRYYNPEKPSDSLINAKIKFYTELKPKKSVSRDSLSHLRDSLSYWTRKSKLKRILKTLNPYALNREEIVQNTDQPGLYALGCDSDALYVTYKKNLHFDPKATFRNVEDMNNTENTIIHFNSPFAFFDSNGWLTNPESITLSGVWSRSRVAGLLPENYEGSKKHVLSDTTNVLTGIYTKLDLFTKTYQPEKVYLHLDKPGGYFSGDTIWYKAYTVIREHHQLSALSGVLYVELISPNDTVITRQTLHLLSGIAWGEIPLMRGLKRGNYRIRAYTTWMRNTPDCFYDQRIRIGGISPVLTPSVAGKNPDVQFFPEGGSLVAGVRSRVAIKSIGTNGLGEDIKGTIEDNEGNVVADFATSHLGMGVFALIPQNGKTYTAKINTPGEATFTIELPKTMDAGYTLALNNRLKDSIYIKVAVNDKILKEQQGNTFYIIAQNNGKVYYSSLGKVDGLTFTAKVEKSRFPGGITQFTLFSQNMEPLAERIAFIQGADTLQLQLHTDQQAYPTRSKVKLDLHSAGNTARPVTGSFSVAVINESRSGLNENNENTILSTLLLTSDLKGYIEQPNYYFTNINDQKLADLDILMLTQGYRRFEWKKILNDSPAPLAFQPQKSIELSGELKTPSGKPIPKGKVILAATREMFIADTVADQSGKFKFMNIDLSDTSKTVLKARKENNGSNVMIYVKQQEYPPVADKLEKQYAGNIIGLKLSPEMLKNIEEYQARVKEDSLKKLHELSGVTIKAKKASKPDKYNGYGTAPEKTIDMNTLSNFASVDQVIREMVLTHADQPTVIVIDGLELINSGDLLTTYSPSEIQSIKVSKVEGYNPEYRTFSTQYVVIETKRSAGSDTTTLKEVKITAKKAKQGPDLSHSENLNGPGNADQIIMGDNLAGCVRLSDCLQGKVFGVTFKNGMPSSIRAQNRFRKIPFMVVIVDGLILDADYLDNLNPSDIYSIEVLRSGSFLSIYGSNAPGGALVITTRRAGDDNYATSIVPAGLITYPFKGYFRAKTFYSPKYTHPKTDTELYDLRNTIYWNPNVITGKDGEASFEYFNNDTRGTYRVVVEGIDDNGNLGRHVYRYKVE